MVITPSEKDKPLTSCPEVFFEFAVANEMDSLRLRKVSKPLIGKRLKVGMPRNMGVGDGCQLRSVHRGVKE